MTSARKISPGAAPEPGRRTTVVIGGGITGLTAAWQIRENIGSRVILVERSDALGGLAQSIKEQGQTLDLGSHRIHEQYDPEVFKLIKELVGADLLKMPRRGQIRIQGRFVNYPPSVLQILGAFGFVTGVRFALGFAGAALRRLFGRAKPKNFEEYSQLAVGDSLYRKFYLPYAKKLWNVEPTELSVDPAVNRMKKFELKQLFREVRKRFSASVEEYSFYYPRQGFGQIGAKVAEKFLAAGGEVRDGSEVVRLDFCESPDGGQRVRAVDIRSKDGRIETVAVDEVISTMPIDALDRLLDFPDDPSAGRQLGLKWRSLRLLFLVTEDKIPSQHETYYFPELDVIFGRVSEIGMYSPHLRPVGGKTALAIEIPCSEGDAIWAMPDLELADSCLADLRRLGLLRPGKSAKETQHHSRRVRNLYPVHTLGWRQDLDRAYQRTRRADNLFPIGRPALFLHCNTDHCMVMALKVSRHLATENYGQARGAWEEVMKGFFEFRIRD